jgi:hypothetical protein
MAVAKAITYFSCHTSTHTALDRESERECGFETAIAGVFISHKCRYNNIGRAMEIFHCLVLVLGGWCVCVAEIGGAEK